MLEVQDWEADLSDWLEPFLEVLRHAARRRWAPVYLRGLFGRTERKSIQPMAADLTPDAYDQLHNFIASRAWDSAALETVLAAKADALVGGPDAVLIIDDVALPKKGDRSVGVAHQYCGALGKAGHLPGAGLPDPGARRGARPRRLAPVPAGRLGGRRQAVPARRCPAGVGVHADQAGHRFGGTGPAARLGRAVRHRARTPRRPSGHSRSNPGYRTRSMSVLSVLAHPAQATVELPKQH